jgi:hypothetical protein
MSSAIAAAAAAVEKPNALESGLAIDKLSELAPGWLAKIDAFLSHSQKQIRITPKLIVLRNGQDRSNWMGAKPYQGLDNKAWEELVKSWGMNGDITKSQSVSGYTIKASLHTNLNESVVGLKEWQNTDFHAWVSVLIKKPGTSNGSVVLLFDPDGFVKDNKGKIKIPRWCQNVYRDVTDNCRRRN